MKPFLPSASSSEPITRSEPVEGFDGAGIGKIVHLKQALAVKDAVEAVKQHLGLAQGT